LNYYYSKLIFSAIFMAFSDFYTIAIFSHFPWNWEVFAIFSPFPWNWEIFVIFSHFPWNWEVFVIFSHFPWNLSEVNTIWKDYLKRAPWTDFRSNIFPMKAESVSKTMCKNLCGRGILYRLRSVDRKQIQGSMVPRRSWI